MHQRIKRIFSVLLIIIHCAFFFACGVNREPNLSNVTLDKGKLSVHYLDVGNGDCILVGLPNGKVMLIDTADKSKVNESLIKSALSKNGITKLDYFILTHMDFDHLGNSLAVLEDVRVENAYLPYVKNKQLFSHFVGVENLLNEGSAKINYFDTSISIVEDDYKLFFLNPEPMTEVDSFLNRLNGTVNPDSSLINNVSAVVYLEYNGVRFVFSGDIERQAESELVNNFNSKIFDSRINLNGVDFLKVAHHGSSDASSKDFLNLLKPKNAIISVGADNNYGHPSTTTLQRLINSNENVNIFRTDVNGTISVFVDSSGVVTTKTAV